uniref:peptide chain release factor N(5)-glutamine methyltransferase n=1 Tax=uncultured bacterium fosmid pJB28H11 TaxID=1478062 RepID=A0A0H3UAE3_9BACT|nr:hypothetical protein [uncultured bacterium fosmid pJB28H11]
MVLILCEERLGVMNYTHIIEPETVIPDEALPGLKEDVRRLASGEPLQYVLGYTDFHGHRFRVNPSVLIPRPETEMLVDEALSELSSYGRPARILDLCTGSGCIAWSVFLESPGSEVLAVDISGDALSVASSQFSGASPEFVRQDILLGGEAFGRGLFDVILSNPPYVMSGEKALMRRNVLEHEPGLALFVPDDDALVFYRAIAGWMDACLRPGGVCLVEINESLVSETAGVFTDAGYKETSKIKDFFGKYRFLKIRKPSPAGL